MKLNEGYFYCFGCGATGDVIDLVTRLFDLSSYEAAQKLAQDFGIDPDKPPAAIALPKPERPLLKAYRQEEVRCLRVLCDYLHLLEGWKQNYAPSHPDETGVHNGTPQSRSRWGGASSGMRGASPPGGHRPNPPGGRNIPPTTSGSAGKSCIRQCSRKIFSGAWRRATFALHSTGV